MWATSGWRRSSAPDTWSQLDAYLGNCFEHETLANGLTVEAACLDTGGHHTLAAYGEKVMPAVAEHVKAKS